MDYPAKQRIVSQCWLAVKEDPNWKDIVKYNDLGMPLAYAAEAGLAELDDIAKAFVDEAYGVIIEVLQIAADQEFDSWADLNDYALAQNGT